MAALVAIAAILAFEPALHNQLAVDDFVMVRGMPVPGISHWVAESFNGWWLPQYHSHDWRPLSRFTLLAQKGMLAAIESRALWPFYAFNILAHAGVCLALFFAAALWGVDRRAALIGALIFAVHPLHAEAVVQIVGRTELLAAFWMLAGLILWTRWGPESVHAFWQQPLIYALALGSKEHAILYPVYLALAAVAGCGKKPRWEGRAGSERLLALGLLLAGVGGLFLWGKMESTGGLSSPAASIPRLENVLAAMPVLHRIAGAIGGFGYGGFHLIWPAALAPDYSAISLPYESGWRWPYARLGLGLIALAIAFCAKNFKNGGRGWVLAAAGLAGWLLTSNLFFAIGTSPAARLWYWPSAAACLGIGWFFVNVGDRLAPRAQRIALPAAAAAAIVLLLSVTWKNAPGWSSELEFGKATVAIFPASFRGHLTIASALFRARELDEALVEAETALRIDPENGAGLGWKGQIEFQMPGREKEAERDLRRSLEIAPNNPDIYESLAILLHGQGRLAECNAVIEQDRQRGLSSERRLDDILAGIFDHPHAAGPK